MMLKLQKDFLQKRRLGLEKYLRVRTPSPSAPFPAH